MKPAIPPVAAVEDPVAAVVGPHVGRRPPEYGFVEALRAVGVGCAELVPHEDALGLRDLARGLEDAEVSALRVRDDRHAPDLAHVERPGRERAACALRRLDRAVELWTRT
jgi:hypothetical protein